MSVDKSCKGCRYNLRFDCPTCDENYSGYLAPLTPAQQYDKESVIIELQSMLAMTNVGYYTYEQYEDGMNDISKSITELIECIKQDGENEPKN